MSTPLSAGRVSRELEPAAALEHQAWPSGVVSESHRQNTAVLVGHLAMVLLVAVAIGGTMLADREHLSLWTAFKLVMAALTFVVWSLYGSRDVLRYHLREHGFGPPPAWPLGVRGGTFFYFGVQLGLAWAIFLIASSAPGANNFLWLVLLPPIGHSVILLSRLGISLVSVSCILILVASVVNSFGWGSVPDALAKFSLAVIFTLVLTQIAVSSERARGEVVRLAFALTDANRKLGQYAVQAEELSATRERNRLAREIHDSVGHFLTVVNVQLEAARATFKQNPASALDALGKAQSLTQQGLHEIRCSVAALRTSPLENRSLPEALNQLVAESRSAGLDATIALLGSPRTVPPATALSLYRAGQEGLTNARKHSQAATVRLTLDFRLSDLIQLRVQDDGQGASEVAGGFGLLGLKERAQLLGGALQVHTSPGQGFTLEIEVPG